MMADLPTNVANTLTGALYADLKAWAVRKAAGLKNVYKALTTRTFDTPAELLHACQAGELNDGDVVQMKCRISPFGPFLSSHSVTPFIGPNTGMRLGPPLQAANPVLGLMAQSTSHLMPVGLFPPVQPGVDQATAYPPDATACGFIGLLPHIKNVVPTMSVLIRSDLSSIYNEPAVLTACVRYVDAGTLVEAGFIPEEYEGLRQAGRIWFLDATGDAANLTALDNIDDLDLWGGLYATGHLEIVSGSIPLEEVVKVFDSAITSQGFDTLVSSNKAGAREIYIYAQGCRAQIARNSPFYSIHMDAEFAREFNSSRRRFDGIVEAVLAQMTALCEAQKVELANPADLDFTYTDGTHAYSVLKSLSAERVRDPIAVAIRDWHRLRSDLGRG